MANQFSGLYPDPEPGDRFGRFTVIETLHLDEGERYIRCRCDCGTERSVRFASLRRGLSRSCGCLHSEAVVKRNLDRRQPVRMLDKPLDTHELAWAAGFFDGEGTTTGDAKAGRPRTFLSVAQSGDPDLLHRFQSAVGGLGRVNGPWAKSRGYRPQYAYQIHGFEAVQAVIAMLWPWLGETKREQASRRLLAFRGRKV